MDPPLRERLSWRGLGRGAMVVPISTAAMARTAAYFAAAGSLVALAAVAIPEGAVMERWLLAAVGLVSALIALGIALLYDRIPLWAFHVGAALGTALASVGIYAWGVESAYGPFPYLWVTLYVFYFFSLPAALVQISLIAAAFAVELAIESPPNAPVAGWVATVGTLLATGLLVALMRNRMAGLFMSLTDAARRDPLTELYNRRGFEEVFEVELERARRASGALSLIVGDLDRFKRVNDEHGHDVGDEVLRRVAATMGSTKRSFDCAARIGGEEFALLAPDSDEHGAYILAERVRSEIERAFGEEVGPLTISLGIATFPLHGQGPESLLRAADQALYAAKRLGRNRAVISSAEVPGILARAPRGGEQGHVELATLLSLAEALDVRDFGNAAHCHRVGRFAELTARELGLPPEDVERLRLAGIVHDVGRVAMPDAVLEKRDPLTEEEWALVRSHPEIGARMLDTTDFEEMAAWVRGHHERPDGRGYPEGLHGEEVPLEARILAVADAYEAMTRDRAYREALPSEQAAAELRRQAGRQFDEQVVEAFLRAV